MPAFAQEQGGSGLPGQLPAGEVRGVVSSGLGEWGLSQRFPDAALWLDLEGGARTLALFWPEAGLPARGALIILADEGENAGSGLAGALAHELVRRKFAVLTLGLEAPEPALEKVLERSRSASEASPDASSPTTIDVIESEVVDRPEAAYRAHILEEIVAGAAELEKREYELVAVVGIGRGSNHVVSFAAGLEASPALIWVDPNFYPRDAARLAEVLGKASVPRILELSGSDDGGQRKASLGRARVEGFSFQSVGAGTEFSPQDGKAIAGRISDWLKPQ
ncbi:DUF3530 family protein [Marinobacter sp. F3R11]|uniref:DUF3530 family protein n=1 Tax=Marinobacter sp. F3R11 TaxID=2267231 RepID=UPI0016516F23|nr:DUF3530 family protein [Marinobacter sp. F3R11]